MKYFIFLILFFSVGNICFGQADSVRRPETTRVVPPKPPVQKKIATDSATPTPTATTKDSIQLAKQKADSLAVADSARKSILTKFPLLPDTGTYRKYETHPWLPLNKPARYMLIQYHEQQNEDDLFYLMVGIVFCLAFTRAAFPKYFRNLFVLFFQSSVRQQAREQILQDNVASLLLNILYFISMGLFIALWIQYRHWTPVSFWILAPGCALLLVLIYLGKYFFLLFSGWVFNAKEAAASYSFVVFMVNKIIGVALIPFLLVLSFSHLSIIEVSLTISFVLIGLLFLYRYFVSFGAVQNKLKVNPLHFFLYLCAVEVLPLVLIYKVLINYIAGSF